MAVSSKIKTLHLEWKFLKTRYIQRCKTAGRSLLGEGGTIWPGNSLTQEIDNSKYVFIQEVLVIPATDQFYWASSSHKQ